jgi:hypothetical protein
VLGFGSALAPVTRVTARIDLPSPQKMEDAGALGCGELFHETSVLQIALH